MNDFIENLYKNSQCLIEKINDDWFLLKEPIWSNWDGKDAVYDFEKEYFEKNQIGLTSLIRELSLNSYDKYWKDNFYILKWNWHKNDDVVSLYYSYQTEELNKKEKIKLLKSIKKELEEEIKSIK